MRRILYMCVLFTAGCWLEGGVTEVEDPYFKPAFVHTVDTLKADTLTIVITNPFPDST